MLLVALGVMAGLALAPNDSAPNDSTDSQPATSTASAIKPGLEVAAAGVFDSFARPAGSLGVADSGQSWEMVSGTWGLDQSNAKVLEPNTTGPSIVIINMRASDGVVQATMPNPERGAGLIFRYENAFNHWALTSAPGSATWVVTKTQNGQSETIAALGTTPGGPNVTIAIQFVGDQLTFYIDGFERGTLQDGFVSGARWVGMIARGPEAANASWTNFVAVARAT